MRKILAVRLVLALTPAVVTPARGQSSTVHVVQGGDNLFRIGLRYGVTVNALVAANGLSNLNHVWVGQRLIIPSGSGCGSQRQAHQRHSRQVRRPAGNAGSTSILVRRDLWRMW